MSTLVSVMTPLPERQVDLARKRLEAALVGRRRAAAVKGAAQVALADAEAEHESAEDEVRQSMWLFSLLLEDGND